MKIPTETPGAAQDALLAICLFAAFADGEKSEAEREEVRRLAEEMGAENLGELSRQILMRKVSLESVVARLATREDRMLAYEMALGICEAGGSVSAEEQEFLDSLRGLLALGAADSTAVEEEVAGVAMVPVTVAELAKVTEIAPVVAAGPDNGPMILKYAILNGALELLPETLATMAIIPLQMKMVYRIGASHGVEMDSSRIKEFLATAGIGMGSQVVEGFARKLLGKFGKKLGGKMVGKAVGQLTGSAFSFASTYALGQVAEKYYGGGRRMDGAGMKALFDSMSGQARELHAKYQPQIAERARTLDPGTILSLVRGNAPV